MKKDIHYAFNVFQTDQVVRETLDYCGFVQTNSSEKELWERVDTIGFNYAENSYYKEFCRSLGDRGVRLFNTIGQFRVDYYSPESDLFQVYDIHGEQVIHIVGDDDRSTKLINDVVTIREEFKPLLEQLCQELSNDEPCHDEFLELIKLDEIIYRAQALRSCAIKYIYNYMDSKHGDTDEIVEQANENLSELDDIIETIIDNSEIEDQDYLDCVELFKESIEVLRDDGDYSDVDFNGKTTSNRNEFFTLFGNVFKEVLINTREQFNKTFVRIVKTIFSK